MNYSEAYEKAKLVDSGLKATDFQWNARVYVLHEDGSEMDFNYAFLMKDEDWVFVFTEHNGFHVWHLEDLETCMSYQDEEAPVS